MMASGAATRLRARVARPPPYASSARPWCAAHGRELDGRHRQPAERRLSGRLRPVVVRGERAPRSSLKRGTRRGSTRPASRRHRPAAVRLPQTLSGGQVAGEVPLADGSTIEQDAWCVGSASNVRATTSPRSRRTAGRRRRACSGEPGQVRDVPPEPDPSADRGARRGSASTRWPCPSTTRAATASSSARPVAGRLPVGAVVPDRRDHASTFWIERRRETRIRPMSAGRPRDRQPVSTS